MSMKWLPLSAFLASASARGFDDVVRAFETWEQKYEKQYPSGEHRDRAFMTWVKNLETVQSINADSRSTWRAGLNAFADMSPTDFARVVLLDKKQGPLRPDSQPMWSRQRAESHPDSFDWREKGAVTPVHDQGSVGTCWAFSTIGNVEGQWFLNKNTLTDLSEEFLVDCDGTHDETHADCGVFGGWPYLAYQYIIEAGGVPSEETWPYCSGTGDCYPCMQGPISLCGPPPYYCDPELEKQCPIAEKSAQISDWVSVPEDEDTLADALVDIGPLSALLDATQLQFYHSGVWTGQIEGSPAAAGCKQGMYNHAVLIVGYGSENDQEYWTVKNSWGEHWGEDGYFRITRGAAACGINGEVTSATV